MASEERKAADDKIKQENLHNSLGAEQQQAETEAFQCGRCKQASLPVIIFAPFLYRTNPEKMPLSASTNSEC